MSARNEPIVPQWLRQQAIEWCEHPSVWSVVLFGSHAKGTWTEHSDWDVAVVHDGEPQEFDVQFNDTSSSFRVQKIMLPIERVKRTRCKVGSLAHEIALHSLSLAGEPIPPLRQEEIMSVSTSDLARHLAETFNNITLATLLLN